MPTSYVQRRSSLAPDQYSRPNANPVHVDSDTEVLKFGTGASGTTLKEVVDLSSTQTLTNKTLTSPVITGFKQVVTDYDGDGAIAIAPGVAFLISADAGAYTLAAPVAADEGTVLIIVSKTAAAHVVTATNLINDGVGPLLDTITFDAQPGAHIQLVAIDLTWYVIAQNGTTATAGA